MAHLKYYKYQNNNAKNEKAFGKWYGRVVIDETVEIEQLARAMQDSCTVKRADILAVLSELGPTMRDLLQDSKRVVIPYLGAFKLGIATEGADEKADFSARNIKGVRVNFQPTTRIEPDGRRVKELTQGCRIVEYRNIDADNAVDGDGSTTGSGSGSGGGSSSDEQPE